MRKGFLTACIVVAASTLGLSQTQPLESFPLAAVQLAESPFQQAQQTDLRYILALDPERLLAPYRREAGLATQAQPYGNWENTGLDGHIGGHYLSALAYMVAATGNEEVQRRLTYIVDQLALCQQKNGNGYLGGTPGGQKMWQEIKAGNIDAGSFSLNQKWVPWYNIHKTYAGLRDAYLFAGNAKAKDMLVQLTNWAVDLTSFLSDAQVQDMLRSEHGGMNEVFADVAAITGDTTYLTLARRFSHRSILEPLLRGKDELNGLHANTQIPKVIGYKRVAEVSGGDEAWAKAAGFFWKTVVDNRTVSIGGNSVSEHFHPAKSFTSMLESKEGPETCNTYNMLKLTKQLYLSSAATSYIDYYERALYNHILSSQHPEQGGFVYFTPMRPRHYRVYSQPQESFWCCVGSGLENHGKYGELIYAHNKHDVFVNLFIPSRLSWAENGLALTQTTQFPYAETSTLTLQLKKARRFGLHIRQPNWVKPGTQKIFVNGKAVETTATQAGYLTINRKWKSGDVITTTLPMETKVEYLPDRSPWVSFVHGPIVLAAITDTTDMPDLRADGSRMGHIANGPTYPLDQAPVLVSSSPDGVAAGIRPVAGKPLTFSAASLIDAERYRHVELVPFFRVHDARYMIYWPVASPAELVKRKQVMQQQEKIKQALEARTVDQVAPGEQQPESDHGFQGERTESGVFQDRHWRHAKGWFSYNLKKKGAGPRTLRVTYYGADTDRHFAIMVNNKLLKKESLQGLGGNSFIDVDYEIPAQVLAASPTDAITLKFAAEPGSTAGGIYYVRLLKAE
jgi:DUF1680 family protein